MSGIYGINERRIVPRVLEVYRAVTLKYPEEVTYAREIDGKL